MNYDFFKNKFLRKTLASWCAFATLATTSAPAWAAVATGDYLGGAANLNGASSGVSNYGTQTATYAGFTADGGAGVLDWNKLNVPGSTTMEFNNGTFYNVVNSAGGMSTIAGAINGTQAANVYIFNPNGILFNSGSSVNVGGVFGALATGVSGSALTDWMTNPGAVPAAIKDATMTGDITVNGGTFTASQLAFAGKNVAIKGGTFNGSTALAAGDKVTIDGFGGGTITLTVPDTATEGGVDVLGEFVQNLEIKAAGDTTVAKGSLKVGEKLTVKSTNGDGVFRGGFVANNAKIAAKSADVDVAGDVWVQGKTDFTATAGDVALKSRAGQVNVLGTAGDDKATIQATGGNLTIDSAVGIEIGKNGVVLATKKADNTLGDVTLTTTGKDSLSGDGIQIAGAGAKVSADNDVTLKAVDGNVTIKDGAEVAAASEAKTLTIEAAKGAISGDATSKLTSKGATSLKAAATENITLEGTENDLKGDVVITSAKDVKIVNNTDLKIRSAVADSLDLRVTDADAMSVKAAGDITAQKLVAQKSDGTANAVFEQSAGTVTVTGGEGIDSVLTAKTVKQTGAGTIKADKIAGDVEQTGSGAAKLQANDTTKGLTITGTLKQNDANAQVGTGSEVVTVGGLLTQDGGTLNANALVLKGGAGQGEQGKIAATTVDLQGESNDFTLLGGANAIGKIGTSLPGGVQTVRVKNASALEIGTAKASGNFLAETADGSITVSDAVTAGENLRLEAKGASADVTIAAGKAATATRNATVKADNKVVLGDGAKLEAKTESVYVESVGNVELGKSAVISAGAEALAGSKVANVLVKTTGTGDIKGMSNVPAEYGTIKAGGTAQGAVVLDAAGSAGENLVIKASDIGYKSTGDITVNVEGDTTLALKSTEGNVNVNHKNGTLTIDALGGAIASDAKVNEVKADGTLLEHALSDYAADLDGLSADKAVTVTGTDGSALAVKSIVEAGTDVGINVDKGVTVDGSTTADMAVKGITAGKTITVKAAGEDGITVSGGTKVSATGNGITSWQDAVTLEATAGSVDVSGENTLVKTEYGGTLLKAKDSVKVSGKAQVDVNNTLAMDAGDKTADSGIAITDEGTLVKAGSDVNLTAAKGDVVLTAAKIKSDSGVYMTASERDVKVNGTIEDFSSTLTAAKSVTIGAGADVSGYSHRIEANKVAIEGGAKITGTADENVAIDLIATGADGAVIVKGNNTLVNAEKAGTLQVTSSKDVFIQDGATLDGVGVNVNADGNAEVSGGAKVLASGQLDVTAGGKFEAKGENTVVKAGQIDESTLTPVDSKPLTLDAAEVAINTGAKVAASGAAKVTADEVTVDKATLAGRTVAIDAKTADGEGSVTIQNGATVAAYDTLTIGGTEKPATLTVQGTDTKVIAGGDLTANAGAITVQNGAKVASDKKLTLTATDTTIDVLGAQVMAREALSLDAKTDVTLDGAVVEGKADVAITAQNGKIEQTGGGHVTVGKEANLIAKGDIKLANAENDFVGTVSADGVNVSLTDKNVIWLGTVLARNGGLNVTALNGSIRQTSDGKVTVGQEANLTAVGGDVNLQNWRNDFQARVNATANDGNVRIRDGVDDVLVGTVVAKKDAVIQSNVEGGKVIADGETAMTANSVSLNSHRGDVSVSGGATLTGEAEVNLTAENDVTVGGEGTTLAAKEITVYTEKRDVVIEDQATLMAGKAAYLTSAKDLTIRKDAGVIVRGKDLDAGEKALTVKALDGSITIDDTTGVRETLVAAKGGVEMVAKKDVVIKGGDDKGGVVIDSYDTLAARARTGKIEVRNALVSGVKDLALTADKGDVTAGGLASLSAGQDVKVTASEGAVTMADAVQVEAGRDVVVTAAKDVSVQDGANVFASRHLTADATEGGLTVGGSAKVRALSNVRLAAAGDTTVNSKVTAGEHLTVIGRNVAQNADFTAEDGSVYVEATGGDIAMAAGTRTVAGKKVAGSTDGQGNILYTATGDIGASGGGATLAADPTFNDGAIVLDAGGTAGRNMTLEAARVGVDAKGDVNLELVGDVNFGARSLEGSVAIVHRDGTLTVDKSAVLPSDKVVKVIDVNTTEDILLAPRLPSDLNGIEAKTAATIVGQPNSTVVVKDGSGVYAKGGDATVTVDKDIRVDGKVEASADALLTAGNDVTVNGTVTADNRVTVTAGNDATVNGTASAGVDVSLAADNDAAVNGTASAGRDVALVAGRDATVDGVVTAGNDAGMAAGRDATVNGAVAAGRDFTARTIRDAVVNGTVAAGDGVMLSAGRNAIVNGRASAGIDATLAAGGDATVNGTVTAGNDATLTAGNDATVNGAVTAGRDALLTAGGDVAVNGSVDARRAVKATAEGNVIVRGSVKAGTDALVAARKDVRVTGTVDAGYDVRANAGIDALVGVNGAVRAVHDVAMTAGRDLDVNGLVEAGRDTLVTAGNDMTVNGTVKAGENLRVTAGGNLATPGRGKLVAGRDLFVDVRSSTPQINVAVGKGISARSGQRAIAFRTVGGYAYPEVYGNNSETAVFIDGRVAGGNAADFAFLQGCEQAAAFGNAYLAPVFTRMADIFPLTVDTDMRAPGASLTQGYMTSDKGSIAEEGDESEEPEEPAEASPKAPVQTAAL